MFYLGLSYVFSDYWALASISVHACNEMRDAVNFVHAIKSVIPT